MRVCLIAREFPPETGWGGIATFTRNLAIGLTRLDHEVEVVALAKDKPKVESHGAFKVHRVRPVLEDTDLELLGSLMPSSTYALTNSAALWQKFLDLHESKPFDVVDSPELLAEGLVPAMTKLVPQVVRLYTAHSKFIAERFHNIEPSFDYELVALLERFAILNADVVTSPSLDLAKFVASDLKRPVESIEIVHNPIDPAEFEVQGKCAINSAASHKVLFVGRLEERKGIEYLIRAVPAVLAAVPDVHFYILGADTNTAPGGGSVKAQLTQMIAEDNTGSKITFLPRVNLTELPEYYRSADLLVVPSLYDNSPYTCLEAMSCGVAVIGTTAGGTPEYLVHEESGLLVPAKNSEALAQSICRLLLNEEERKQFGHNARARVVETFAVEKIAAQTVELYELAQSRYAERKHSSAVYAQDLNLIAPGMEHLLRNFQVSLHKMLYAKSLDYRLKHWLNMAKTSPRVLWKKGMGRLLGAASRPSGY